LENFSSFQNLTYTYNFICTSTEDDLNWLNSHIDPPESVIRCWEKTFTARRNILKKSEGQKAIDYINRFASLQQQLGKQLVSTNQPTVV